MPIIGKSILAENRAVVGWGWGGVRSEEKHREERVTTKGHGISFLE